MRVQVVDSLEALEALREPWDALAVAAAAPFSAPAWALAWWRHARPARAVLRALAAFEGEDLVAMLPAYAEPGWGGHSYALLSKPVSDQVEPLAAPGREQEAADAFARALGELEPRPGVLALRGLPADGPWPSRLARAWPGRPPWLRREPLVPAPGVDLAAVGDFDGWLASRSGNFRQQARRLRRRLEEDGAASR